MPPSPETVAEIAAESGFDLVRIGPADPGADGERFLAWLDAGRHGEMEYLERNRARIADPALWQPGARSTVSAALDYGGPAVELPGGGAVARYAVGRDYHRHMGKKVRRMRSMLERAGMPTGTSRGGTDSVPVLERALAARAGIGFLAKSAMVISPTHGPYLLLAELLTPLDLPPDEPAPGSCGTCTACLEACPTGAIVAPFEVDARICLSYTTIELRGFIAEPLRRAQGDRFFGCDVCLEVCPFTSRSPMRDRVGDRRPADLKPHPVVETWSLVEVLTLDEEDYQTQWTGTAMRRATRSGLRRNAAVVLGNLGDRQHAPALAAVLSDTDPVVRGHAAWALGRLDPDHPALERALTEEPDARVVDELRSALTRR